MKVLLCSLLGVGILAVACGPRGTPTPGLTQTPTAAPLLTVTPIVTPTATPGTIRLPTPIPTPTPTSGTSRAPTPAPIGTASQAIQVVKDKLLSLAAAPKQGVQWFLENHNYWEASLDQRGQEIEHWNVQVRPKNVGDRESTFPVVANWSATLTPSGPALVKGVKSAAFEETLKRWVPSVPGVLWTYFKNTAGEPGAEAGAIASYKWRYQDTQVPSDRFQIRGRVLLPDRGAVLIFKRGVSGRDPLLGFDLKQRFGLPEDTRFELGTSYVIAQSAEDWIFELRRPDPPSLIQISLPPSLYIIPEEYKGQGLLILQNIPVSFGQAVQLLEVSFPPATMAKGQVWEINPE